MPAELLLERRLRLLGLRDVQRIRTHTNRTVMVTWHRGTLRIHRGYAAAPDRVLRAIVRFLRPGLSRKERKAVEHQFLTFPVERHAPTPPGRGRGQERPQPGDLRLLHRLALLHERLNQRYFGRRLRTVPFRLSGRMRTRLGEVSVDIGSGKPVEIALSRLHLRRHSWEEIEHTVLHEMIHQWQAETGHPVDHGPVFRRKAREVGIAPRARRRVSASPRRLTGSTAS